jgi:hypothetical protein
VDEALGGRKERTAVVGGGMKSLRGLKIANVALGGDEIETLNRQRSDVKEVALGSTGLEQMIDLRPVKSSTKEGKRRHR